MYDKKEFSLSELLENSTRNASILIPNLQRPYVWNPDQISCLVDSLFRGWPFGTLLTWTVKASNGQREGIPSRTFFTLVDRTHSGLEKTPATRAADFATTDTMVLDGQQRLQSLILALGESDGICMYDSDWIKLWNPSSRQRTNANQYTTASLCLNLERFLSEMSKCNHRLRSIGLHESRSLCWAVMNQALCSSQHRNGKMPLPLQSDGGVIALKSMWEKVDSEHDEEDELKLVAKALVDGAFPSHEKCLHFCELHGGYELAMSDLAKFLRRLCELKDPSLKITSLNITAYSEASAATPEEKQKARQEYDDAIVGIFTRLNTAGRALTREEITFAWLKSTWNDVGITGDVYSKAEDFVAILQDNFMPWKASADDVVRALSIIWCVHDSERCGQLLENRELLQAGIIRKMSLFLRGNADAIVETAKSTKNLYEDYHLTTISDSFNGIAIAWALYFTAEKARRRITQTTTEYERDNSKKAIGNIVRFFISRWAVLPSWGGKWAAHTAEFLGQVSTVIANSVTNLATVADMNALCDGLNKLSHAINGSVGTVQNDAMNALELRLLERKVFLYRSRLEVWQGLDQNRARFRTLTFRDANSRSESECMLQVDHIVAYNMWKNRIESAFANGSLSIDQAATSLCGIAPEEISRQKSDNPQEFEQRVRNHSIGFINRIGSCMLLNAGYNIAKRTKPLGVFMDDMYEFRQNTPESIRVERSAWMNAMKLTDVLIYPNKYSIQEIANSICQRELAIYTDLRQFIANPEPDLF